MAAKVFYIHLQKYSSTPSGFFKIFRFSWRQFFDIFEVVDHTLVIRKILGNLNLKIINNKQ